jgi:hypothetical protein
VKGGISPESGEGSMILDMESEDGMEVTYTYGVEWINSETSWATRW